MPGYNCLAVLSVGKGVVTYIAIALIGICVSPPIAQAQSTRCGTAVVQLQHYVQQVNQIANFEFYQGIPQRCGWNRICAAQQLQRLNFWYSSQTSHVNNWYAVIVQQCTSQRTAPIERQPSRRDRPPSIDTNQIEELELDNEDTAVRIKIPSPPSGLR